MAEQLPEHFSAPVEQAITQPILWAGVPRWFGYPNCCLALGLVFGLHWYWYAAIAIVLHAGVKVVTKWDPYCLHIMARSLRYADFYHV